MFTRVSISVGIVIALSFLFGVIHFFRQPLHPIAAVMGNKNLDVVFIVIDTLRADHLPMYGYRRNTSPFLQTLSARSVLFEKAIAASSWTAPSVASLFTSQYPSQHGLKTGMVVRRVLSQRHKSTAFKRIARDQFTLPEYFQERGYQTLGVSDNQNIGPELGFDQGFSELTTMQYEGAPAVNEQATRLLKQVNSDKPLFLYLQYMDPHAPYHARLPWYTPSSDRRTDTLRRYNSEILYVDQHIELLFAAHPRLQDALIIITSDHGEQFWEHGLRGHGKSLHRQEIHVPLLIAHKSLPGVQRVQTAVSLIDLLPTVCELTRGDAHESWSGSSLVPVMQGKQATSEYAYSELLFKKLLKKPSFRSVVDSTHHLITSLASTGNHHLYAWESDLLEKKPLSYAVNARLAEKIEAFDTSFPIYKQESTKVQFDEKAIRKLESLGYIQ